MSYDKNLATVTNKDGTEDLVQIFAQSPCGEYYYVFMYPPRPVKEDCGREVNAKYLRKVSDSYAQLTKKFPKSIDNLSE